VPIWRTQYIMVFVPQVSILHTGYIKILRDLVKLPAHRKQVLSPPGFCDRLLPSHCCDITLISNYVNLSEINHVEETLLWHFRICVHVPSSSEKAHGTRRFSLDTTFQWKWCGTQHAQWSGSQVVNPRTIKEYFTRHDYLSWKDNSKGLITLSY